MAEFLISFFVFAAVMAAMAVGVLRGGRSIEGSCGGLNRIPGIEPDCGGQCRRRCPRRHGNSAPPSLET